MKRLYYLVAVIAINSLLIACQNTATKKGLVSTEASLNASTDSLSAKKEEPNTEDYAQIIENDFTSPIHQPLSTFSIDVDEAAYSNVRRFIQQGQLPPAGAVRIEEMINYFKYDYPQPEGGKPFSIITEIASCPWNTKHQLVHIGLQGKNIPKENLPASNLVFLIDVSGSMSDANKLPLVKSSLKMLTEQLRDEDNVAIVVYAGNAGLVLPSTKGSNKSKIISAIEALESGGSTSGGEGIQLAYKTALEHFKKNGNNRIILCTDGDFNVGPSSDDELVSIIEKKRQTGIYLSILGYGMGNYKDNKMQQLADKGNGNHYYIDNINEARKVLVSEFGGTLFTIAKDVKIQVEFNPTHVQAYRLIGYENRVMAAHEFNDDKKDAGELGAGHTVTALYEIIPVGEVNEFAKNIDKLKYQKQPTPETNFGSEMMNIKLRYKLPKEETSRLITYPLEASKLPFENSSLNFKFSAAVAEYGLVLRNSIYKQQANYQQAIELAKQAKGSDEDGYRAEFIQLVKTTSLLGTKNE